MGAILLIPLMVMVVVPMIVVVAGVVPLLLIFGIVLFTTFLIPLVLFGSSVTSGTGMALFGLAAGITKRHGPEIMRSLVFKMEQRLIRNSACEEGHDFALYYPSWSSFSRGNGKRCRRKSRKQRTCATCTTKIDRSQTQGLGYVCTTCGTEICMSCYLHQRTLNTPHRSVCLPFHSLFEQESVARSLMERGYALIELDQRQRSLFIEDLSTYKGEAVDGCFQARERDRCTPFMHELKHICTSSLPSDLSNSVLLSAAFTTDKTEGGPPLIAHDATAPPSALTCLVIDESLNIGDGIRVVDKRFPGMWLSVSSSLASPPRSDTTFVCLVLGEGIRLYSDDVRLRPSVVCSSAIEGTDATAESRSERGYVTLDVQVPIDLNRVKAGESPLLALGNRVEAFVERNSVALKLAGIVFTLTLIVGALGVAMDSKLGHRRTRGISRYL